jgi:hypothetical protein
MPDALTLWSLAVLVIGGLMYAAMSMSTKSSPSSSTAMAIRRPGWIARGELEVASCIAAAVSVLATARHSVESN